MARMTRTQIMLDSSQMELLAAESQATGKSKSELIRLAIDATYDRDADTARRLAAWHHFVTMERPGPSEVAPKDTSPNLRENLYDRGPGGRGW